MEWGHLIDVQEVFRSRAFEVLLDYVLCLSETAAEIDRWFGVSISF